MVSATGWACSVTTSTDGLGGGSAGCGLSLHPARHSPTIASAATPKRGAGFRQLVMDAPLSRVLVTRRFVERAPRRAEHRATRWPVEKSDGKIRQIFRLAIDLVGRFTQRSRRERRDRTTRTVPPPITKRGGFLGGKLLSFCFALNGWVLVL